MNDRKKNTSLYCFWYQCYSEKLKGVKYRNFEIWLPWLSRRWGPLSFGNVTAESNAAVDTLFGFTGKALDEATGLQNNWNRWYDASVGRWVSQDPIGFAAGDANVYRYVGNETPLFIDPDGLNEKLPDFANERLDKKHLIRIDKGPQVFGGFEVHVFDNKGNEVAKIDGMGHWCEGHNAKEFEKKVTDFPREMRAKMRAVLRREAKSAFDAGWRIGKSVTEEGAQKPKPPADPPEKPKPPRGPKPSRGGKVIVPSKTPRIRPHIRGAAGAAGPVMIDVAGGVVIDYADQCSNGRLSNMLDNTVGTGPSDMLRNLQRLFGSNYDYYWGNLGNRELLDGEFTDARTGDKVPRPISPPEVGLQDIDGITGPEIKSH